jgi:hypothetical protein
MKILFLLPFLLASAFALPEELIAPAGGGAGIQPTRHSPNHHADSFYSSHSSHLDSLGKMMGKKNYVKALSDEIEKSHKDFMKVYDAELKKLRELTLKRDMREGDYSKAKGALDLKYKEFQRALDDIRSQNATLVKLKGDDDYEEEKHLVSHFNEYVKVYKSLLVKDKFIRHHCICNHSVF